MRSPQCRHTVTGQPGWPVSRAPSWSPAPTRWPARTVGKTGSYVVRKPPARSTRGARATSAEQVGQRDARPPAGRRAASGRTLPAAAGAGGRAGWRADHPRAGRRRPWGRRRRRTEQRPRAPPGRRGGRPSRRPENGRPENGRPENGRPEDGRPRDRRPEDGRPRDRRPEDGRPRDRRPGDGRAASTCQQALWRAATVGNGRSARCGQRGWVWKARTWVTPWLPGLRLRPVPRRRREAGDVAPLPWRLNGARVVVPPDKSHRPVRWNSVDHGEAGQRRTRPSAATTAGDLDAFRPGAFPSLVQDLPGLRPFAGQPEVAPAHPSALPGDGGWPCGEQVDGEGGSRSRRKWLPQPTTPDQAARW